MKQKKKDYWRKPRRKLKTQNDIGQCEPRFLAYSYRKNEHARRSGNPQLNEVCRKKPRSAHSFNKIEMPSSTQLRVTWPQCVVPHTKPELTALHLSLHCRRKRSTSTMTIPMEHCGAQLQQKPLADLQQSPDQRDQHSLHQHVDCSKLSSINDCI